MTKTLLFCLHFLCGALLLHAQQQPDSVGNLPARSVHSSTFVGLGSSQLYDAYLSPLDYRGTSASITQLSERPTPWAKGRIGQVRLATLHATQAENRAQTGTFYDLETTLALGYHYQWHPLPHLRLACGPLLGAHLGGTYAPRNGNNPAQARLALDLGIALRADYRFRLFGRPWQWFSHLDAPLLGAMFAPHFGQSYYEIFSLGHSRGNIVATTPFSAPSLRWINALSLPLWGGRFSIGVENHIRQSRVHQLGRHAWQHHLLVGYTRTLKHLD